MNEQIRTYEVVEAKTREEAEKKSFWRKGDLARCVELKFCANGDGTFTICPLFEKIEAAVCRILSSKKKKRKA